MILRVGVALGRALVVVERDARRDDVEHHGAAMRERRLEQRQQLLLVARERARDERRAELDRQRARVDRRQVVDDAGLELRAEVRRRRELALGQAVAAVVLDDVDDRQVAAHQVHELADADRAGVAVAADADGDQLLVGQHRAGADRRHAAVDGVEAVRAAEEVRRALARAADARQLDDLLGIDAHLVERVDDALGDRVVAAAGAQRRLAALVDLRFEPDSIHFDWCRHVIYSPPAVPALMRDGRLLRHFEAFLRQHIVGDAAGVDRQAVVVQHAAQLRLRDPA